MSRVGLAASAVLSVFVGGCASHQKSDECEADFSPEGYALVLRTEPNVRVDYEFNGTAGSITTTSGVETIDKGGKAVVDIHVVRCVRLAPQTSD